MSTVETKLSGRAAIDLGVHELRILVLQGRGALGAYQAGVYEGLPTVGFAPNWVGGVSIGAINSALIAGNPPERQLERLRESARVIQSARSGTSRHGSPRANRTAKTAFYDEYTVLPLLLVDYFWRKDLNLEMEVGERWTWHSQGTTKANESEFFVTASFSYDFYADSHEKCATWSMLCRITASEPRAQNAGKVVCRGSGRPSLANLTFRYRIYKAAVSQLSPAADRNAHYWP